jgi:sterol desaturase/sphingolipid hydroxylase (fatty acid hydroxylase superfamily)
MDYTAIAILACIFIPLERLFPLHREQGTLRRDWMNDVFYLLVNGFVVRAGFTALAALIMMAFDATVGSEPLSWVRHLPLWVQVIAVIVVADIGYYTAHRLSHAVPFLWQFHAVHHSIEEMDWLAAHRVHPVDQIFTNMVSMLPIYFLGFSLQSVLIYAAIYQAHSLLVHANVRMNFGPLKWLIASPEYHHWHHANEPEAYDRNFAAQLSIIDVIAGTLFMPKRPPAAYGINEPMPRFYPMQLVHPFRNLAKGIGRRIRARKESSNEQDA